MVQTLIQGNSTYLTTVGDFILHSGKYNNMAFKLQPSGIYNTMSFGRLKEREREMGGGGLPPLSG